MDNTARGECRCQMCELEAAGLGPEAYLGSLADRIGAEGWAVQAVPDEERGLSWAYTVGLWHSCHAPELAIFGLPLPNMAGIANTLARHVSSGVRFEPGDRISGVCPCTLTVRPVDAAWRATSMFAISDAVYGRLRPPMLQVVWPDREDRFPWERGFDLCYDGRQPMLWLPPDDNPPGRWTRLGEDLPA